MINNFKIAVAILSANVKEVDDGRWVSSNFSSVDFSNGSPGGKFRIQAGYYLYRNNPENIIFITSGGRGHGVPGDRPDRPDLSAILRRELMELGVAEKAIIEENRSNKTFEQLIEIGKLAEEYHYNEVIIITNEYHTERVKAMLKKINVPAKKKLIVASAEKICIDHEPKRWKNLFNKIYNCTEMRLIVEKEKQGAKQLEAGIYRF